MATESVTKEKDAQCQRIAEQVLKLPPHRQELMITLMALVADNDPRILSLMDREKAGEINAEQFREESHLVAREVMASGNSPLETLAQEVLDAH
jgi:hypothetical protein